jgi:ferredoxin
VNLFSLAQRMTEPDRPPIALDADGCLHSRDRFSTCDACISVCPVKALRLVPPITLDEKTCVACGACLPVCPVGALTGKDGADDLVRCISQIPDGRVVELACARHTTLETGPAESTAVVRTEGCLAALGPSTFEWLLANETQQVIVRLDACSGCSIGNLQPRISRMVAAADRLAPHPEDAARIVAVREREANWKTERTVIPVKNPPVSRRDLFRTFVSDAPKLAAQVLPFQESKVSEAKAAPLERRRLLNAIRRQGDSENAARIVALDNDLGLVRLAVSAICTACGVCARACPTGALRFEDRESSFRLTFSARACTDCGACLDLCEPNALARDGVPTIAELMSAEPVVLRSGTLRKCEKCGAKFAGDSGGKLCPTCDFRVHNPFGSRMPARTKRQS